MKLYAITDKNGFYTHIGTLTAKEARKQLAEMRAKAKTGKPYFETPFRVCLVTPDRCLIREVLRIRE